MGHTLFYITDGYEQMMKYALETYLKQTQNNSINQNIETTGNIEVSIYPNLMYLFLLQIGTDFDCNPLTPTGASSGMYK